MGEVVGLSLMLMLMLLVLSWSDLELKPTREVVLPMQRLFHQLHLRLTDQLPRPNDETLTLLATEIVSGIERYGDTHVNRFGNKTTDLPISPEAFVGGRPMLPPEQVRDNQWLFQSHVFHLRPRYLFVRALTFKPTRTVRLKRIVLHFHDGESMVHDSWSKMEDGNGKPFSKRGYLPWLSVNPTRQKGPAKRLAAIEVLGSAQDAGFSAALEFMVRIPDTREDRTIPALAENLHKILSRTRPGKKELEQALSLLRRLASLIGLVLESSE